MRTALAIDIGASSGRHIVGWLENGVIKTEEVYRFPNGPEEQDGHLVWNTEHLLTHVKTGIAKAKEAFPELYSLSVDTWGVDYVLLNGDRELLPCFCYRDSRTQNAVEKVHSVIPFAELYSHTGIQFQSFNTVYQLMTDLAEGRLDQAADFLMMPEYLMYRLCGAKAHEYTNATTGGLVNAGTGEYDQELISRLGLPARLFQPLQQPGEVIGVFDGIRVMLCATHDTGSAVEGIPMEGNEPYISSGTWSLLGVRTPKPLTDPASREANYSNEGGVGYNRYQKNLMGMWLVNRLKEELCPGQDFETVISLAKESSFEPLVDVTDPAFMAPESMSRAFDAKVPVRPAGTGDYFRCALRSLASGYARALDELEHNTGRRYSTVTIVGGGAKNTWLNQLTEEFSGRKVIALPIEATALGNLKIQLEAML